MPLWVPEWIVTLVGRSLCRLAHRHNVTCRGRRDHFALGVGVIDLERWGWPHR